MSVVFDGRRSSYKTILCRMPQDSILGLLLFLVLINDLPLIVSQYEFLLLANDGASDDSAYLASFPLK